MMRIQTIQVGETKNQSLRALENEYETWLRPWVKWKEHSLKASSSDNAERARKEEAALLLKAMEGAHFVVALTPDGQSFTSEAFAHKIEAIKDREGELTLVIGGSHGLHASVLDACREQWSLSPLTFTHELTRVVLKEQIYRAFSILAGKNYHK